MRDLLASCAAADAISTPPRAPERQPAEPADSVDSVDPMRPAEERDAA
ncbi:hypothetical protein [Streptomyces sp. AV19]